VSEESYGWGVRITLRRSLLDAFQDLCQRRGRSYSSVLRDLIAAEVERDRGGISERGRQLFRLRYARAKSGIPALLLAIASPLAAQEAEPPADAKQPVSTATILVDKSAPPVEPGLYAAAFCTQRKGENDPSARCDLGVAVPLYHRVSPETRRGWAVVGFLGGGGAGEGEDLGIAGVGSSWLFPVGERQGGLGLGWSVLWGGEGIDVADGRLTVGFTIGGRR
jgi:hypothetical protein